MKKTLIALAALAATGAFAQSAVTISGYFDRGYTMVNNTNDTKDVNTVSSSAGTTGIAIAGSEDLGGGMKAGFLIGTDWADLAGANQDFTATTASSIQTGGFANAQSYLELSAKFGTLRLGTVNNEILTAATAVAAPAFSTAIGSAYSSNFSTHNGYGTGTTGSGGIVNNVANTANAANAGARGIRQANTIKYISPNFSGFQVALGYAPKNDVNGTGDTVGVTDFSLRYTAGALDVMYAALKYEVGSNGVLNGSLTPSTDNTHQLLAASYAIMPSLKVHAGLGRSSSSDVLAVDANSRQIGVSWAATPAIDVMGQIASVDDNNTTANNDRRMTGLGVDYKFSKNTRAYVRYDNIDYNTNTTFSGSQQTRTALGLSVKF